MQRYASRTFALLTCAILAACQAVQQGMEGHDDVVARAAGFELTVDHAARLIAAGDPQLLPAGSRSADLAVDIWINHTLLAAELASPDALDDLDLSTLAKPELDQALVLKLHEEAILSRIRLSDDETPASFADTGLGASRQTRHILILVPDDADPAERDRLRRRAEAIRDQLLQGADFADLARRVSEDPASAPGGGNLGWVRRGQLVPDLETVIFALEPQEISQVVRSAAGFHIVQVTDVRSPEESQRSSYLEQMMAERRIEAERAYVDSLFAAADTSYVPDAAGQVRRLAQSPRIKRLSEAEREAILATYRGGSISVGDVVDWIIKAEGPRRNTLLSLDDAGIISEILQEMLRSELLVKAANDLDYTLEPATRDDILASARRTLYAVVTLSGIRSERLTDDEAIMEAVDTVMARILRGERSPVPASRVRQALRQGKAVQIYPHRFPRVVERVAVLRGEAAGSPAGGGGR